MRLFPEHVGCSTIKVIELEYFISITIEENSVGLVDDPKFPRGAVISKLHENHDIFYESKWFFDNHHLCRPQTPHPLSIEDFQNN